MCNNTQTAVTVVKTSNRKSLTKEETLMLFEQVCKDTKGLSERIDVVEKKIDQVLDILNRPTFGGVVKSILSNKVFVYILVTILTAVFGVQVGGLGLDLLK